jgi:excisionase family DNA binding protein
MSNAQFEGFANARPPKPSNDTITPLCYRINDACRLLSISRSHLYDLASEGRIRIIKIGNRSLISASEIARLSGAEAA